MNKNVKNTLFNKSKINKLSKNHLIFKEINLNEIN